MEGFCEGFGAKFYSINLPAGWFRSGCADWATPMGSGTGRTVDNRRTGPAGLGGTGFGGGGGGAGPSILGACERRAWIWWPEERPGTRNAATSWIFFRSLGFVGPRLTTIQSCLGQALWYNLPPPQPTQNKPLR